MEQSSSSSSSSVLSAEESDDSASITKRAVQVEGDLYIAGNLNVTQNINVGGKRSRPQIVTTLPPCESPPLFFSGRTKFLEDLHTHLTQKCAKESILLRRISIISGLGGIGKSSTALQYAHDYAHHHHGNTTWFDADTEQTMIQGFMTLAEHFRIENLKQSFPTLGQQGHVWSSHEVKKLVSLVYRYFSTHVKKGLFIFDNAHQMRTTDGVFGIQNFIPNESFQCPPLILVTSTSSIWGLTGHNIGVMTLPSLSEDESLQFVKKVFGLDQPNQKFRNNDDANLVEKSLKDLCQLHGGYPLALNLAASRLSETMTLLHGLYWSKVESKVVKLVDEIRIYQTEFETNGQDWIHQDFPQSVDERYDKIMATVWKGTVQNLEKMAAKDKGVVAKMAIELLNLISYLPSINLTVKFCYFVYHDCCLRLKKMASFNVQRCRELQLAFGLLGKYSMVAMVTKQVQYCVGQVDLESFDDQNRPRIEGFLFGVGSGRLRVHQIVQKWTRENLKRRPHNEALHKIAQFYARNYAHAHSLPGFHQVLTHLKENEWPSGTWIHHISMAHCAGRSDKKFGVTLLSQVYSHLQKTARPPHDHDDQVIVTRQASLDLCQMALVYCNNWPAYGLLKKGLTDSLNNYFDEDNDTIMMEAREGSPLLGQINLKNFLDFALDRLEGYEGSQFAEPILASILLALAHSNNLVEYAGHYQSAIAEKLRRWVERYALLLETTEPFNHMGDETCWTHLFHWLHLSKGLFMFSPHKIVLTTSQAVEGALEASNDVDVCIWEYFVKSIQYLDTLNDAAEGEGGGSKVDGSHLAEALACNKALESTFHKILSRGLMVIFPSVRDTLGKGILIFDFVSPLLEIVQNLTLNEATRKGLLGNGHFMTVFEKILKVLMDSQLPEQEEKYDGFDGSDRELQWSISLLMVGFGLFSTNEEGSNDVNPPWFRNFLNISSPFSVTLTSNQKIQTILRRRVHFYFSTKVESKYKGMVHKFLNYCHQNSDIPDSNIIKKLAKYLNELFDKNQDDLHSPTVVVNSIPSLGIPSKPSHCVNRSSFLTQLHSLLTTTTAIPEKQEISKESDSPHKNVIVVITGVKGIGKTMTAISYAHSIKKYENEFHGNLTWIDADTYSGLTSSFVSLAHHLGIDTNDKRTVGEDVYRHFSHHVKKGLFIFDGLKVRRRGSRGGGILESELKKYLPQQQLEFHPTILVTTRRTGDDDDEDGDVIHLFKNFCNIVNMELKVIHLGPMNEDESVRLLWKLVSPFGFGHSDSDLKELQLMTTGSIMQLANCVAAGYPLALTLMSSIILQANPLPSPDTMAANSGGQNNNSEVNQQRQAIVVSWCDQNVQKFVTSLHHHLDGHHCGEKGAHFYNKILATLWNHKVTNILATLESPSSLAQTAFNILHILAYLPKDEMSIKFIYFILNCLPTRLNYLGQFKIDRASGSEALLSALRFLEQHSIIKLAADDTEFLLTENNDLTWRREGSCPTYFFGAGCGRVYVKKCVQKWTREADFLSTTIKNNENEEGVWILVDFYKKNWFEPWLNHSPFYFDWIKTYQWPQGTQDHYLYCAYRLTHLTLQSESKKRGIEMLADFSQFLTTTNENYPKHLSLEYFEVITMLLFNVNRGDEFTKMRMRDQASFIDNFIDASSPRFDSHYQTFEQKETISLEIIHNWVLDRMVRFPQNLLVQMVGTGIMEKVFRVSDYKVWFQQQQTGSDSNNDSTTSRLIQWARSTLQTLVTMSQENEMVEPLLQDFGFVMDPQSILLELFHFPVDEVIQFIVQTTEIRLNHLHGVEDRSTWFQFFHNLCIFDIWDGWNSMDTKYFKNALSVKTDLVNSGVLNLLTRCCKDIIPLQDINTVPVYLGKLFEILQELAHVETLAWRMLDCVRLTGQLGLLHEELLGMEVCVEATRFDIFLELMILSTLSIFSLLLAGGNRETSSDDDETTGYLLKKLELSSETFFTLQTHSSFLYNERWCLLGEKSRSRGVKITNKILSSHDVKGFLSPKVYTLAGDLFDFLSKNYDQDEDDAVV